MLRDNVLQAATPLLVGRTITRMVLGMSLIGVELDGTDIGLAYMLRDNLPAGCGAFAFGQSVNGADAETVAQYLCTGENDAQRGVGMAAITAAICAQELPNEPNHPSFGISITPSDTVGMIGHIPPVAARIQQTVKKLILFDEGIARRPAPNAVQVEPTKHQGALLPECDVVIMTGTVMINNTVEDLLPMCVNARHIVMVGASTPMLPEAFLGSGITMLAGSCWDATDPDALFTCITLGGGIGQVSPWMIKKAVRVE